MKVARIVAAALAFASASTAAVEPFLPNASLEFESTEAGFSYRILQQTTFAVAYLPTGDVRVESTVERFNLSTQRGEKMRVAATGCLTQGGGYIGYLLADCVFHTKLDTDSRRNWTVIPRQTGHRFQSKLDSHL